MTRMNAEHFGRDVPLKYLLLPVLGPAVELTTLSTTSSSPPRQSPTNPFVPILSPLLSYYLKLTMRGITKNLSHSTAFMSGVVQEDVFIRKGLAFRRKLSNENR